MRYLFIIVYSVAFGCTDNNVENNIRSLRLSTQKSIDSFEKQQNNKMNRYLFVKNAIQHLPVNKARNIIDSLIKEYPNDNQIRIYKGDLYVKSKSLDSAISEFSLAVARNYTPVAYEKRAIAYILQNNLESALSDFRKAAELNSDYYYSIGYTFELMKKYDSALRYFRKYSELNENNKEVKLHIDSVQKSLKIN